MTTFAELKRRVFESLGAKAADGQMLLAVERAINEAHITIARVYDFDELIVLDTTNAFTQPNQKLYHITDDLKLVRPKDIFTIRYMDGANSRKLTYVSPRELDQVVPYTELYSTGRPSYYTRRGMYIELFRIPDESKPLYIMHSQWPPTLVDDTDETPYLYIDDVIVALAAEIATSILSQGATGDWALRAKELLGLKMTEELTKPDVFYIARPFSTRPPVAIGKYWTNPWVKKEP